MKNTVNTQEMIESVMPYLVSWIEYLEYKGLDEFDENDICHALSSDKSQESKVLWEKIQDMTVRDYKTFIRELHNRCDEIIEEEIYE